MRVVFLVTLATLALSAPIQHETSSPAAGHHAFSLNSLVGSIASSSTTIVSTACKWLTTAGRAPSAEVVAARGVEVALAQADVMTGWAMEDEEEREDRCFSACNRRWVAGMDTSDGGPCSDESLNNTLECAQCIDSMWPPKENEQSALAEYSALVLSCQAEWPM